MADDDLYSVPRDCREKEVPPSLPPKRSNSRVSVEGLSRAPPDARPKPMPRRTVARQSPSPGESEEVAWHQKGDASSSPSPFKSEDAELSHSDSAVSLTTPSESEASPASTPKPAPRPLPRRHSLRSQSDLPMSLTPFEENLPPSADEVEKMLEEEMAMKEQKEDEQGRLKQQQQEQSTWYPDQPADGGETLYDKPQRETDFPSSLNSEVSREDKSPCGVLTTNLDEVMTEDVENDYVNTGFLKSSLSSNRTAAKSPVMSSSHGQRHGDGFDSAFGGSFDEYAKVQKSPDKALDASPLESFDPFRTRKPNEADPSLGLSSSVLTPTQVWTSSTEANCSHNASSAADEEVVVPEATDLDQSAGDRDSAQYETLWFSKREKRDMPGMVRPQSNLMTFTPQPLADGVTPPSFEPGYGERSGEYIGLDPTYMVPPPPEPPPPLPSQAELKSRPPSIPPRPPAKNPAMTLDKIIFEVSSHLSESITENKFPEQAQSVVESSSAGFSPTLNPDDPFKYSGFDAECQMFNTASSSVQSGDIDSSIYMIEDNPMEEFVTEWPSATTTGSSEAEGDSFYHVIEHQPGSLSREASESFRLSQVPPPPPRPRRGRESGGTVSRELPGTSTNHYSLANADELELSRSVDSSDSSEDIFSMGSFGGGDNPEQRRSELLAGAKIIPPLTPRKNERYGYLYKQGGVKANRGWRMRWVVFNGKDLRYYDNNRSQISKKIIPLSSMKQVISDIKDTDTTRFKFRLVTTLRDRTFLFAADTRDDCCTWTSTLMAAILNKDGQPADETEDGKPDKEGFVSFENSKKKLYVAVWGKTLCYYDSFEDFQMHCPVHEIDMKLSSVKDKKKNRLQLSTHYAHFSLMFDSQQEAQSWRMAIEDAIAEGLADDSVLEKVYENDSNRICADCEDENPHWASINLGIVLCKKCAGPYKHVTGVHRMFETSVTKIRSLRMDTRVWTPSLIELMKAIGNGNANLFWEHDLLPIQKLLKDSLPEERKEFAQFKYQHRRYSNQHSQAHDRKLLNEALLQASRDGDLLEAMKIIFSGADLSYAGGAYRENAYQTAKRNGQRLLMELLYQNGGDCVDTSGDMASDEGRLREDVRLQGYLQKTGPVGRTFDTRWCVLEHGTLTYYLNEKSTTAKDSIDRKCILRLQEITSDRPDYVFEISTTKGSNRVYTFAAENSHERGMWMRTLGKLISPVAVMEHVGMMDFSLASLVFMRESISEDWRPTWVMLSWRLLNYMNKELKLDHIDLRKATQIRMQDPQSGSCHLCLERGACFVLNSPGQTFYIQANLQRDTKCIFDNVSATMKRSGRSLLDQQLTADNVPVIVDRCLKQLDSRAQQEEGIYRKAAINSRVDKLIQDLKTDAYALRLDTHDIHEVANALKRFLRELDDSLFMRERYNEWIRTSMIDDHQNKFLWYRYLLEKLPLVNYNTLRRIILHISKLAEHEVHNKMNIMGLCTCFAPTLMRTENDAARGNNPGNEIKVMLDLVSQRDYLFQIEQQELDHEDIIKKAADKIKKAQEDVQRQSQPASNFLMPISMHNHSGQCEMVNTTASSTAQDVVQYLSRKCSLSGQSYALYEILCKGALTRPLFPGDNIMMTTGRWGDWEESVRKESCLCVDDTNLLDKLDRYFEPSKALFGELKYADSKSKSKFRKTTVGFKQCVLTFYKDSRARHQLCSWKVEELSIYLGIDPKRSPPSNYGFTFVVNSKEERSKNSCFGHCVSLGSEEEMYHWVAALLVAQIIFSSNYRESRNSASRLVFMTLCGLAYLMPFAFSLT